jgi:hypothetical protein
MYEIPRVEFLSLRQFREQNPGINEFIRINDYLCNFDNSRERLLNGLELIVNLIKSEPTLTLNIEVQLRDSWDPLYHYHDRDTHFNRILFKNLNCRPLINEKFMNLYRDEISKNIAIAPIENMPEIVSWPAEHYNKNFCSFKRISAARIQKHIDKKEDIDGYESNLNIMPDFILRNLNNATNFPYIVKRTNWESLARNINFKAHDIENIGAILQKSKHDNRYDLSYHDAFREGFLSNPNLDLEYVKKYIKTASVCTSICIDLTKHNLFNWHYLAVYRDRRNARIKRAERIKKLLSRVIMRDFLNIVCKYTDYN